MRPSAYAALALFAGVCYCVAKAAGRSEPETLGQEARRLFFPKSGRRDMSRGEMVDALERLKLRGLDLDERDSEGNTLLIAAINEYDLVAFEALLDAGASIKTSEDRYKWKELYSALRLLEKDSSRTPIAKRLLERAPSERDKRDALEVMSKVAAQTLARRSNPRLVAPLYELGADPNIEGDWSSWSHVYTRSPPMEAVHIFEKTGDPTAIEVVARAGGRFDGCSEAVRKIAAAALAEKERVELEAEIGTPDGKGEAAPPRGRRRI